MKAEVKQSVIALVNKVASYGRYSQLYLSSFGGEPLLCFDTIVCELGCTGHAQKSLQKFCP